MYVSIHTYMYIRFTFITFEGLPHKVLGFFFVVVVVVLSVFETGSFYIILDFLKLTM